MIEEWNNWKYRKEKKKCASICAKTLPHANLPTFHTIFEYLKLQ